MNLKDYPVDTLMDITARPDVVFVKGEGSWLWDHEGRRYLDFVQGWAVNTLGHSPRILAQASDPAGADPHHVQPGLLQRAQHPPGRQR